MPGEEALLPVKLLVSIFTVKHKKYNFILYNFDITDYDAAAIAQHHMEME